MKNYTKEQLLDAINNSNGVMEYVAVTLNCSWETARRYVRKWEETKQAFAVSECKLHSIAYKSFHKAIGNGERWAIERILDTSARRNGHGVVDHKKVELENPDGSLKPNVIEIIAPTMEGKDEEAEKMDS